MLAAEQRNAFPWELPVIGFLLCLWCVWFFGARISVTIVCKEARLELSSPPQFISAGVDGRIDWVGAHSMAAVRKGEPLFHVDDKDEREKLASDRQRLARLKATLASLREKNASRTKRADAAPDINSVTRGAEAALEAQMAAVSASIRLQDEVVAKHTIVAPIGGILTDVSPLNPGAMVRAGERLATVSAPGQLEAFGWFPAGEALGRIRPGQEASIRLDAFPWRVWGTITARVSQVGAEGTRGLLPVHMRIINAPPNIPLRIDMTGSAAVTVTRTSPAKLILQTPVDSPTPNKADTGGAP